MLKIGWVEKIRNFLGEEVLRLVGEERKLRNYLVCIRDRLIGHNHRHPDLLIMLMEGTVDGKNCVGRKRLEYMDQIVKDVRCGG